MKTIPFVAQALLGLSLTPFFGYSAFALSPEERASIDAMIEHNSRLSAIQFKSTFPDHHRELLLDYSKDIYRIKG